MAGAIVRNPSNIELEKAADVAYRAFEYLSLEHWKESFYKTAEMFGERFILVAEVDGEIVSSLLCSPSPIYMGDSLVSHSAVGGVGTLPEYRNKGYAGVMMEECVRLLHSEGILTSSLWPFSYEYYRKFGWEVGAEVRSYSAEAKVFAQYGNANNVRGAAEGDFEQVKFIFNEFAHNYNCLTQRSDEWWSTVARAPRNLTMTTEPGRGMLVHVTDDNVDGYIVYEVFVQEDKKSVNVKEIVFDEPAHRRDMLAALEIIGPEVMVAFQSPADDLFLHELPNPRIVRSAIESAFQFRVFDPELALTALTMDNDISGRLSFKISDPILENEFQFGLEIDEGEPSSIKYNPKLMLETDIQTFAKMYSGYLSPADAWYLGKLETSGDREQVLGIASQIFSPLQPYRSWLEPG